MKEHVVININNTNNITGKIPQHKTDKWSLVSSSNKVSSSLHYEQLQNQNNNDNDSSKLSKKKEKMMIFNSSINDPKLLVSKNAFKTSLSPPRVPTYDSVQYKILISDPCYIQKYIIKSMQAIKVIKNNNNQQQQSLSSWLPSIFSTKSLPFLSNLEENQLQLPWVQHCHYSVHYPNTIIQHDFENDGITLLATKNSNERVDSSTPVLSLYNDNTNNSSSYQQNLLLLKHLLQTTTKAITFATATKKKNSFRQHGKVLSLSKKCKQRIAKQVIQNQQQHPHLSKQSIDSIGRYISKNKLFGITKEYTNALRDNGTFRTIVDNLVMYISIPTTATNMLLSSNTRTIVQNFIQLSNHTISIPYGQHPEQVIDFYYPYTTNEGSASSSGSSPSSTTGNSTSSSTSTSTNTKRNIPERIILFIHGGAWGSGKRWFYRLVAQPFIEIGYCVAIIGYRTYPCSKLVQDQINDIQLAYTTIQQYIANEFVSNNYININNNSNDIHQHYCPITLMGHSSGAHIALLYLVDKAKEKIDTILTKQTDNTTTTNNDTNSNQKTIICYIDSFIGMSGPYDISYHFDYESERGVEELSPMKPINGNTRINFKYTSPSSRYNTIFNCLSNNNNDNESIVLLKLIQLRKQQQQQQQQRIQQEQQSNEVKANASCCNSIRRRNQQQQIEQYYTLFPLNMLFVHGIEDDTVPFTSTSDVVKQFRSFFGTTNCTIDEVYIGKTNHQDTITQFMFYNNNNSNSSSSPTQSIICNWLQHIHNSTNNIVQQQQQRPQPDLINVDQNKEIYSTNNARGRTMLHIPSRL